jgi:L-2-hydroxyglutarate oxidase LhgO
MAEYCDEHGLPIRRLGKVIVPARAEDDPQLDVLRRRAEANGARVEMLDERGLREAEPAARTASGRALLSPATAVVASGAVLEHLAGWLEARGVRIARGRQVSAADPRERRVRAGDEDVAYGHLYNAAGLHADRVARLFGAGERYTILPFKGIYYRLDPSAGPAVRRLVYPVPDLRYPFLGVHFTRTVDDAVYAGPTAVPALGRENYRGLRGLRPGEAMGIAARLMQQYARGAQGFRRFAHAEGRRYLKRYFAQAARELVPAVRAEHLLPSSKVGIRAQLLDRLTGELVMDFVVEEGPHSTHVLNAVSPGFTSAFSFARMLVAREAAAA